MSLKYLNSTGLSNLVTNIKNWVIARIPTKTSEITNDSGFITSSSLPTVNNATLTIQKNGTNVQTFTANASSNKTANITVPTKTSELTNDSGFLTNTSDCVHNTGNETVAGEKTFSDSMYFSGNVAIRFNRGGTVGTNPSSTMYYQSLQTRDTNSTTYYLQRGYITTGGTNAYTWYIYKWDDTSKSAYTRLEMTLAGTSSFKTSADNLVPVTNDATNLGASGLRWKAVYSNSYYLGTTAFGDIVTHNSSEYSLSSHTHSNYLSNSLTNNTTKGALGWSSSIGTNLPTLNTIAYWNGAYANTSSNLAYCVKGAFGDIVTHNASEFLTSHQSLSNYSTLANTVKSISISGKTITVTPGSGSTYTLTTQDTVYTHPTSAGNKHIPSGGAANQYLKYSASGTAVWANLPTIPTKTSELTNDSGFLTSHQSLSGYLPLTGGTVTGATYFTADYFRKDTGAVKGTAPSANRWQNGVRFVDNNNVAFGGIERGYLTDKTNRVNMIVYKGTTTNTSENAQIGVGFDKDGNWFTYSPTPAANDNTTKIATTAWVQTFCGTTKGYLTSHQSLSNYVTLNGAQTITAEKTFKSDIVFNGTYNLRSSADNSYVRIQGGSGEGKGSRIILSGKTRTNLQGYAEIVATDGTNTNTFTVKPNGETLVNGNNLAATIIKGLSISGKTITYTQINGSTGTITTQDTVYTHPTSAGNKHIPSGGSSGQYLKYSSSGTATWANLEFNSLGTITKADLTQNTTTWSHTVKTRVLCFLSCDCTTNTSGSCKFKVTGSNIFRLSLNTLVGNNNYKQDTVTYGGFLDQGSTGRARFVALFYPYSSSISFTIIASGVGTPNNSEQVTSFSMTLYQLT